VEAVGENEFAVVVRSLGERGAYFVGKADSTLGQYTFAVNGPAQESDLRLVDSRASIGEEGVGSRSEPRLWLPLMGLALLCLLVEMAVAAGPSWRRLAGREAA